MNPKYKELALRPCLVSAFDRGTVLAWGILMLLSFFVVVQIPDEHPNWFTGKGFGFALGWSLVAWPLACILFFAINLLRVYVLRIPASWYISPNLERLDPRLTTGDKLALCLMSGIKYALLLGSAFLIIGLLSASSPVNGYGFGFGGALAFSIKIGISSGIVLGLDSLIVAFVLEMDPSPKPLSSIFSLT